MRSAPSSCASVQSNVPIGACPVHAISSIKKAENPNEGLMRKWTRAATTNRAREIRTAGSLRDGASNDPIYSAAIKLSTLAHFRKHPLAAVLVMLTRSIIRIIRNIAQHFIYESDSLLKHLSALKNIKQIQPTVHVSKVKLY